MSIKGDFYLDFVPIPNSSNIIFNNLKNLDNFFEQTEIIGLLNIMYRNYISWIKSIKHGCNTCRECYENSLKYSILKSQCIIICRNKIIFLGIKFENDIYPNGEYLLVGFKKIKKNIHITDIQMIK